MKRCLTLKAVLVAALCFALCAVSGYAQFQTGNIFGKVQAKDGSALPGVTVTLTGIGAPQQTVSDALGVQMDRMNVGGNMSGQQSSYVSKGVSGVQSTWNVDGVNITDFAATGSSPTYYDFGAFEEMQITTGGTDPRIQTAGVQLNMV